MLAPNLESTQAAVVTKADIHAVFAGKTFPLLSIENNHKIAEICRVVGWDKLTN
jgi:hypothetical protein